MLAFFCLGSRYRPWRYFAALHSRVFGDGAAPRRTRCSPQPRQHSVFRASGGGVLQVLPSAPFFFAGRAAVIWCGANPGVRPWQDLHECVLGRLAVAIFSRGAFLGSPMTKCSRNAFPSVRQWQDCALMRSWPDWQRQYSRAMRSQVPCRGKISPRCVPGRQSVASFALHASQKWSRTGKSPVRGKIRAPCIRNELVLAGYACHASEKPRKPPLEDTPREYLARKGHFSLHGSLESRMARESCHPSWRQTARVPATPAPPSSASRQS